MTGVRGLGPAEWPLWRDLRLQALADAPDAFGETLDEARRRSATQWRDSFSNPDLRFFLAQCDGANVGIALVSLSADDARQAHLYAMWVAPAARRCGVGRALIDAAVAWVKQSGRRELHLSVADGNPAAARLYRNYGFRDTGERTLLRPSAAIESTTLLLQLP